MKKALVIRLHLQEARIIPINVTCNRRKLSSVNWDLMEDENCNRVRGRVASSSDMPKGMSTTLRRAIGILEILLALAFFGGLIQALIKSGTNIGLVGLLDDLVLFIIGAVFVKLAISNLKRSDPD
jgi:hypothetical protein